jgi:NAD(P)-dependent dehydrogenase (short-subunit alcohol dehydrogenase family)
MDDLKGKKILVTGGGGEGVGGGVCQVLDRLGATILLNEINLEKATEAASRYSNAIPLGADISDNNQVSSMFSTIADEIGVVDGLVNNAGVGLSKLAHEASEAEFNHVFDIDIKGVWRISKAFVRQLLKHETIGSIVNISSINARATMSRYAIYASAKSAVEGLTMGMAVELGVYKIRVNAIGPGLVKAEQNYQLVKTWSDDPEKWIKEFPMDQQAIPEDISAIEIGNVASFLLSDLASGITGQTLYVDKGTTSLIFNRFCTERR